MTCHFHVYFALVISLFQVTYADRKFPENFLFGTSTSAYQVEGAWNESDKGQSIWDVYTHSPSAKIIGHATGDVSVDSYHFYHKDVAAMRELGVNAYRFSLSWSRLLPNGYVNYTSQAGLKYYNSLINELVRYNITPIVTLYHWDTPEPLQKLGGFMSRDIIDPFVDYVMYAFEQFGDRVKHWATFNEINMNCNAAYGSDTMGPAINLPGRAEYLCAHYMILAHAHAYRLYDKQFRPKQKGQIGIVHQIIGYFPLSQSPKDLEAADLAQDFICGWILHPIFSKEGDYPPKMKEIIKARSLGENLPRSRLPQFTPTEIELVKGSADYLGVNHYTSLIFTFEPCLDGSLESPMDASPFLANDLSLYAYQLPDWTRGDLDLVTIVPEGFRNVLKYIKTKYASPPIIITENGFPYIKSGLNDFLRVECLNKYLSSLLTSIHVDGVDVRGYMHWSLLDNFEWNAGYAVMYGLYAVNYTSPTKERIGRLSSRVYKNIIKTREINFNFVPVIDNDALII